MNFSKGKIFNHGDIIFQLLYFVILAFLFIDFNLHYYCECLFYFGGWFVITLLTRPLSKEQKIVTNGLLSLFFIAILVSILFYSDSSIDNFKIQIKYPSIFYYASMAFSLFLCMFISALLGSISFSCLKVIFSHVNRRK